MPIDYKKYPPNWKELRELVLKRANNCCEFCGLKNYSFVYVKKYGASKTRWFATFNELLLEYGEPHRDCIKPEKVKQVKVVLTIAHLDHDETNHDVKIERLAALCQLCHLTYDIEEKKLRRLMSKNNCF